MSKVNSILEKATQFEKLAVLGKKGYLLSLADDVYQSEMPKEPLMSSEPSMSLYPSNQEVDSSTENVSTENVSTQQSPKRKFTPNEKQKALNLIRGMEALVKECESNRDKIPANRRTLQWYVNTISTIPYEMWHNEREKIYLSSLRDRANFLLKGNIDYKGKLDGGERLLNKVEKLNENSSQQREELKKLKDNFFNLEHFLIKIKFEIDRRNISPENLVLINKADNLLNKLNQLRSKFQGI